MDQPSPNPYLRARQAFESIFLDQARARRNWQLLAFLSLALSILLAVAYVRLASHSRITPYVVEVDRLGRAVAFGPAESLRKTDQRITIAELTRWLANLRTVTSDGAIQRDALYRAYSYLAGDARDYVDEYFRRNDPRLLAAELTRTVEDVTVLPIPNSSSWRLTWLERERPRGPGPVRLVAWEAYATVAVRPPTTADHLSDNPLGLYVEALTWTRVAGKPKGEPLP